MVEIILIVGLALILGNWVAEKFKLISPLVLIAAGVLVALIPGVPQIDVPAEVVLSVFLPLLLYWEALNISLRGIRRFLRGILLNGTLMVIFVAVSVGLVGQWIGFALGTALLIGAAIGPTDATAVAAFGKGISRGQMLVLRAESLINDGTALVIFALALEYASGEAEVTLGEALVKFVVSFVGGSLVGFVTGWAVARLGRFVEGPLLANACRIITPFIVYFLAESIEASGVLAVVVCGLYMAQVGPKFISVGSRFLSRSFWGVTTYILNAFLFLMVGLNLPRIVSSLSSDTLTHALMGTVVLYLVMFFARWFFGEIIIRLIRLIDRRESQKLRRTTWRQRVLLAFCGFRGAISLAVAYSVPLYLSSGEVFPQRDLVIFVTSGIVILSLLVQGLSLPAVARWAEAAPNPHVQVDPEAEDKEIRAALIDSVRDILDNFPQMARENEVPQEVYDSLHAELTNFKNSLMDSLPDDVRENAQYMRQGEINMRLAIIRRNRENIIRYRDQGKIDDEALVFLMDIADLEELRLTGPVELE